MTPEEIHAIAHRPPKVGFWTTRRLIIVMTGVLVFALIGQGVNFKQNYELRQQIFAEERAGLANRVIGCKIQIALEIPLGPECASRQMLALYDPEQLIRAGGIRSDLTQVICFLAHNENNNFPEICEG